jgi:hypothetical protein
MPWKPTMGRIPSRVSCPWFILHDESIYYTLALALVITGKEIIDERRVAGRFRSCKLDR